MARSHWLMAHGKTALIFVGPHGAIDRAVRILDEAGISHRATRPRRGEGCVYTAPDAAVLARAALDAQVPPGGRVVRASEASLLFCPECGTFLSMGSMVCPDCKAVVGDPQGR